MDINARQLPTESSHIHSRADASKPKSVECGSENDQRSSRIYDFQRAACHGK